MAEKRDLGIALSGGGVRATAFSLGGLLYLVDSGLNRRVGAISSVSGGSVANAFLVKTGFDFGETDRTEFDEVARKLVFLLTRRPIMGWLVVVVYSCLIVLGVLAVLLLAGWPIGLPPWLRVAALLMWGVLFLFRGWPIEMWMHWLYFGRRTLEEPEGSSNRTMAHVFCTTDLGGSAPVYFLAQGHGLAYTRGYGNGRASHIRLATAVRASAALPGAFPPRLIRTKAIHFLASRIRSRANPPWALFLADGGVWNNLGTQWFEGPGPRRFGQYNVVSGHEVKHLLVLNASGPLRPMSKIRRLAFVFPLLAETTAFGRVVSSLYANTVEPRVRQSNERLQHGLRLGSTGTSSELHTAVANINAQGILQSMIGASTSMGSDSLTLSLTRHERMKMIRQVVKIPSVLSNEQAMQGFGALLGNERFLNRFTERENALNNLIAKVEEVRATDKEALPASIRTAMPARGLSEFCSRIGTKLTRLKEDEVIALIVHGYLQTMEAAAALCFIDQESKAEALVSLPDPARFTELLPQSVK